MAMRPDHPAADEWRLVERLRGFRDARGWARFHSPNRLAAAISIEAAEVLEHFLWVGDTDAETVAAAKRDQIAEELADVLIYLIYLSDRIGIDLLEAAELKIDRNEDRFPVLEGDDSDQVKGGQPKPHGR